MSLGVATSAALGGLRFTAQGTRVVAENLANAETAGYGLRRTLATGTIAAGSSTIYRDFGVIRNVDPVLLSAVRNADTQRQGAQIGLSSLGDIEQAFGMPGDPGSLSSLVTGLTTSLSQAAATPDALAALQAVAQSAKQIVSKFNAAGEEFQGLRQRADSGIAKGVYDLNSQLAKVAALNKDIQRQSLLGGTPFALMDERDHVISEIATLLPVNVIPRENNRAMLVTARGEVLVDLEPAEFNFTKTPGISAADTRASGALGAIALNGRELSAGDRTLSGGALGAYLAARDTILPRAQAELDYLAMDLLSRFSGPNADNTLAAGELGLFALSGSTALPTDPTGVSLRLRVAPAIDPSSVSDLWRLRTGLNAATPGPSLDTANLANMMDALETPRAIAAGRPALSLIENVSQTVSQFATARLGAEGEVAYAEANFAAKQETLLGRGVDTDTQMQDLLTLERAYAANARVLTTIDSMMRQLLEI